ncbi:MAG TPA: hypothetical protein VLT58_14685 [Polyangia bacterium]|nr:hypothetical protein [Polyangia bacterium]
MRSEGGVMESEVQAVLERGRTIRRLPDMVRTRALARARAAIVAEPRLLTMAAMPAPGRRFRIALAASMAVAVGTAGAAAALRTTMFSRDGGARPPVAVGAPIAAVVVPTAADPEPVAPPRLSRFAAAQESYRAEVGLLQRAQAAYGNRNFAGALALVGEHGRRFPNGRLAEEREALRVRSLAAAGRQGEARRAATIFAHRFPRSVLLPRLQETVRAGN